MKKLEAVIFDMDGVLFDTERMSCECCFEAASSWDLRWRRKQSMAAADEMKRHFADILWRRRSPGIRMDLPYEKYRERFMALFQESLERELPIKKGV